MRLCRIIEYWDCFLYFFYNIFAGLKYLLEKFKYQPIFAKNVQLKNKHNGERCFVIMNGSSVNKFDLSKLENEYTIVANYFYKSPSAQKINPKYYCWLDSGIFKNPTEARKTIADIKRVVPHAKLILNMKALKFLDNMNDVFFTYHKHLPNTFGGIKSNLAGLCSGFTNVFLYAINVAIYMGFKEIYIIGLDFEPGWAVKGEPHFYSNSLLNSNLNKSTFSDTYYYKNIDCDSYWNYTKAHYEAYAMLKHTRKNKVKVINLNPESYMRAFPFGNFNELF